MNKLDDNDAIVLKNLTMAYDLKPVIYDVNLRIARGALLAIVGPNGAGKSTLIKGLLNLVKPLSGTISYFGQDFAHFHRQISYVPQKESVDWDFPMTVREVVLMGRYGRLGWFHHPHRADYEATDLALTKVEMNSFANHQIAELSGGQQQRVFLARALASEAEVYILDEPFQGVDIYSEQTIVRVLKELHQKKKTIIVVHHNLETAAEYFSEVALINVGLVASGPIKTTLTAENVHRTYRK